MNTSININAERLTSFFKCFDQALGLAHSECFHSQNLISAAVLYATVDVLPINRLSN